MKHSKSSKAKQIYFHEKKLLLKFKFQFNSKNPSPQSSWHWQRSIWESHQTTSHQSRVCCSTSRRTALKKRLTSVWIYILLRERKPHVKNLQITASQSQIWHARLVCGIPHLLSWSPCWEVKLTHPHTYKARISGQLPEMLCVVNCHCMGSLQLNCPVLLFKKGNYCC